MIVYRLSREKYASDLMGTGVRINGGRWNSRGKSALYTAQNISLAKLEVTVHLNLDLIPDDYCLITIEFPNEAEIKTIKVDELSLDWDTNPLSNSTQVIGDNFLNENKYLAFKVPSSIVHQEYNFIINPNYPSFSKVKIIKIEHFTFEDRLFRL